MRRCPSCDCGLIEHEQDTQVVDRCVACRGMFFDRGELESIVAMVEVFVAVNLDEAEIDAVPQLERLREVRCPHDGASMAPRQIGALTLDVCPGCGGVWLDGGELAALKLAERHIRDHLNLYIRLGS